MAERDSGHNHLGGKVKARRWALLPFIFMVISLLVVMGSLQACGKKKEETAAKEERVSILCPLESFIVNLADKSGLGKRYLKITMEFDVGSERDKQSVEKYKPQLRDTILLLLSTLSFKEISTMDGKLQLKQEILSRANHILGEGVVRKVYFSEFVVQ